MTHTDANAALWNAPPGWPTTDDPIRVAILGWARLSAQAREGSGYNLSASELASGLSLSGHRVFYLRSGMDYALGRRMHIRRHHTWRGIECYDLFNSPNLSPAAINFKNMASEMHSPAQTRLVLDWLKRVDAQVVHIHSHEGYGLDLIGAIRDTGRPVVATLHNYWFACPQVDLLHEEVRLCDDYDGGRRCVGCLKSRDPREAKLRRALGQTTGRLLGHRLSATLRSLGASTKDRVKGLVNGNGKADPKIVPPDPELALGFDAGDPAEHDGQIHHNLRTDVGKPLPRLGACEPDQNERFLGSDVHLKVVNEYGRRRREGIAALNRASLVTPPSEYLRRVHVAMGVEDQRTRHVRLGQPHFDQINRRARRSPYYDVRPWDPETARRPLRLAFLGTTRHNKGLDILARAIPLLSKEVRQRCQFLIRAQGWDWPFRARLSLYPEVQFAGGYDLFQLIGAWGEYDVGILCHIWFENSPLVMLEHLHGGRFVLSPRLGGPVDWIDPPRNGLLYPAGHPEKLADCITQLVTGEVAIPSPREVHEASVLQSYPDHVREVAGIYRELLNGSPTPEVHVKTRATEPAAVV